jgi:TPR repeat protein
MNRLNRNPFRNYLVNKQKFILFVDTETTGIPFDTSENFRNIDNWPTIKQIAWIIYKKDGTILAQRNYIINDEADSLITSSPDYIPRTIMPIYDILVLFQDAIKLCDVIVGHNIEYDVNVILSELHRYGYDTSQLSSMQQFCTMKNSIEICGFDSRKGDRYPKLQELYSKLFHHPFDNAHDAYCDIKATANCFWEFFSLGLLKKEDYPYLLTNEEKETAVENCLNNGKVLLDKNKHQKSGINDETLHEALSWFEKALSIKSEIKDIVGGECFKYAKSLCGDINNESFFMRKRSSIDFKLVKDALFCKLVKYYELFKGAIDELGLSQNKEASRSKYQEYKQCALDIVLHIIKCCFDGIGTPQSPIEAKKWIDLGFDLKPQNLYLRSRDNLNHYYLTYYTGLFYEETNRNEEALSYFLSTQDYAEYFPIVFKKIGIMYLYGRGCKKSKRMAREYLKEAQSKGVEVSQYLEEAKSLF